MPQFLKTKEKASIPIGQTDPAISSTVSRVIDDIRAAGDAAVRSYSEKFDKWSPASFKLSATDIENIMKQVPPQIIADIVEVQKNVRTFAEAQKRSLGEFELEIQPGVFLGQRNNPVASVGA
jgi:histidinol dehydrogenase